MSHPRNRLPRAVVEGADTLVIDAPPRRIRPRRSAAAAMARSMETAVARTATARAAPRRPRPRRPRKLPEGTPGQHVAVQSEMWSSNRLGLLGRMGLTPHGREFALARLAPAHMAEYGDISIPDDTVVSRSTVVTRADKVIGMTIAPKISMVQTNTLDMIPKARRAILDSLPDSTSKANQRALRIKVGKENPAYIGAVINFDGNLPKTNWDLRIVSTGDPQKPYLLIQGWDWPSAGSPHYAELVATIMTSALAYPWSDNRWLAFSDEWTPEPTDPNADLEKGSGGTPLRVGYLTPSAMGNPVTGDLPEKTAMFREICSYFTVAQDSNAINDQGRSQVGITSTQVRQQAQLEATTKRVQVLASPRPILVLATSQIEGESTSRGDGDVEVLSGLEVEREMQQIGNVPEYVEREQEVINRVSASGRAVGISYDVEELDLHAARFDELDPANRVRVMTDETPERTFVVVNRETGYPVASAVNTPSVKLKPTAILDAKYYKSGTGKDDFWVTGSPNPSLNGTDPREYERVRGYDFTKKKVSNLVPSTALREETTRIEQVKNIRLAQARGAGLTVVTDVLVETGKVISVERSGDHNLAVEVIKDIKPVTKGLQLRQSLVTAYTGEVTWINVADDTVAETVETNAIAIPPMTTEQLAEADKRGFRKFHAREGVYAPSKFSSVAQKATPVTTRRPTFFVDSRQGEQENQLEWLPQKLITPGVSLTENLARYEGYVDPSKMTTVAVINGLDPTSNLDMTVGIALETYKGTDTSWGAADESAPIPDPPAVQASITMASRMPSGYPARYNEHNEIMGLIRSLIAQTLTPTVTEVLPVPEPPRKGLVSKLLRFGIGLGKKVLTGL